MSRAASHSPSEVIELLDLAEERGLTRNEEEGGTRFRHLNADLRYLPTGTAQFDDQIAWGYPRIGRILRLDRGLKRQFDGAFFVEEKIDGYNTRFFLHQGRIQTLTRRGYLCPFTQDRAADLINPAFFDDHPDLILCVEVAGPDNPYNEGYPPQVTEDVQAFVFDIMRFDRPGFLSHQRKLELLEEYGLQGPAQLGRFEPSQVTQLETLMRRLDGEGKEGIVLKSDKKEDTRAKYITGHINIDDIRITSQAFHQLPAEFYVGRILRLALFLDEQGIEADDRICRELGQALLAGMGEAIRECDHDHRVTTQHRCRFRTEQALDRMMAQLRRLLGKNQLRIDRRYRDGAFWVVEFSKTLPKTSGLLMHILGGGLIYD